MIKKILLVNILVFLSVLFIIESISRVFISKDNTKALFNDQDLRIRGRSFIQKNDFRGFSLVSNFENDYYHVNNLGYRGESFPKDLNKKKIILTMGESTTFGWGVHENETYPYYLMQNLQSNSKYYVINAGVPSYTSAQVLLYMQEIFTKGEIQPDIILVNIMWNDIWYSSVKNWHQNILVYQKPPVWLNFLTKHSYFFYGLLAGFQKQNNEKNIFNNQAYHHYLANLTSMINLANQYKSKIIFVEAPFDSEHLSKQGLKEFQIHYTKDFLIETAQIYNSSIQKLAKENNISFITHRLGFNNIYQKSLFLDALHPTNKGNKIMAEDITKELSLKIIQSKL